MVEEPAIQTRPRRRVPLVAVLLAAGVALAVPWLAAKALPHSSFYGRYVCGHCGVERTVARGSVAGVTYDESATVKNTVISRALNSHQDRHCVHEWYLVRSAAGSRREIAHGGKGTMLPLLLIDDEFAGELAEMPHPPEVWHAIISAGDSSPKEIDRLLGDWWPGGEDQPPFAEWWQDNEERIKQLGASAGSAAGP
jgi:hypothetical protein